MSSLFLLAETATDGTAATGGIMGTLITLAPILLVFVVFYFMLIRPQKKRDKAMAKMRSELEIGDQVITVGGIIGIVVRLHEDNVIIESGTDRNKFRVARWAIQQNITIHDDAPAQ